MCERERKSEEEEKKYAGPEGQAFETLQKNAAFREARSVGDGRFTLTECRNKCSGEVRHVQAHEEKNRQDLGWGAYAALGRQTFDIYIYIYIYIYIERERERERLPAPARARSCLSLGRCGSMHDCLPKKEVFHRVGGCLPFERGHSHKVCFPRRFPLPVEHQTVTMVPPFDSIELLRPYNSRHGS